jgi:hypothetical protein
MLRQIRGKVRLEQDMHGIGDTRGGFQSLSTVRRDEDDGDPRMPATTCPSSRSHPALIASNYHIQLDLIDNLLLAEAYSASLSKKPQQAMLGRIGL